ncbi:MAG: DUF4062 domain-containing protein [Candidatus Eremiobacteraeota bacterium]|nr:DUF4062 domain-containing protein [Candidatus Eremiobacteraeota bacterium]
MARKWRTIKVFISSTFRDMHAERDHLVKVVFPELRERLEKHRIHLVDIDLRWGVTKEQADNDQALGLCLDVIDECRPFFIGILGERYGWVPETFPRDVLYKYGWDQHYTDKSITALEIIYGVLKNPKMKMHSFFYFRDPSFIRDIPETVRKDVEAENSESVEKLRKLKEQIRNSDLVTPPMENYPCRYAGLRVMWRLAKRELDEADRLALEEVAADGIVDPGEFASLDARLRRIVDKYGVVDLAGLEEFGNRVRDDLWAGICREYPELIEVPAVDEEEKIPAGPREELAAEQDYHDRFVESRLQVYVGREKIHNELMGYINGEARVPMVVPGPSGSGKSAIMGKLNSHLIDRGYISFVMGHFVGASPQSSNLRSTLRRFCLALRERFNLSQTTEREGQEPEVAPREVPEEPEKLPEAFREFLASVPEGERVVFIIDALNQMDKEYHAHDVRWLPRKLPPNVKIVVSCIEGEKDGDAILEILRNRKCRERKVESLTPKERFRIVTKVPSLSARTLDGKQVGLLLSNSATENPLYLLVALEELRGFGSFDLLNARIKAFPRKEDFEDPLTEIFIQVIERLEEEFDADTVRQALSLIAVSRHGLSERELRELLLFDSVLEQAGDFEVEVIRESMKKIAEFPPGFSDRDLKELIGSVEEGSELRTVLKLLQPCPDLFVILRQLRPYILRRGELVDFFHTQLRVAVEEEYLHEEYKRIDAHNSLSEYFSFKGYKNRHAISEMPYHQTLAQQWNELEKTLTNLRFAEAKCVGGMLFDLLRDCDRAIDVHDSPPIVQMRNALSLAMPGLSVRPELAVQLVYNRLSWFETLEPCLIVSLELAKSYIEEQGFWISAEAPLPGALTGMELNISFGIKSSIQSISSELAAIAIASLDGCVEIRDIFTGEVLNSRQIAPRINAIALSHASGPLAFMDVDGIIRHEYGDTSLSGRRGEKLLLYHPIFGILAAIADNTLVAWNPDRNESAVLVADMPRPLVLLKLGSDVQSILFIAGFRNQKIGISKWTGRTWETKTLAYNGPPVLDADLDSRNNQILLTSMDRKLKLLDTETSQMLAELTYEARKDANMRGAPDKCALGMGDSVGWAFFATRSGHIGSWNWRRDILHRLEDWRALIAVNNLINFTVIPESGHLFFSTDSTAKIITRQSFNHPIEGHTATINACLVTDSYKIVSASELEHTIRWFVADGLRLLKSYYHKGPTAIASCEGSDDIIVGTNKGLIWRQPPNIAVNPGDVFMAFAEPVVSLFSSGSGTVIAAGRSGRVLRIDLVSDKVNVLWHSTGFQEQQKIIPAGNNGLFWSLRREEKFEICTIVSLVRDVDKEEVVLTSRDIFQDLSVSRDGSTICVVGESVQILRWSHNEWEIVCRKDIPVDHVVFMCEDNRIAVVLRETPWLEVWSVTEGLPMIASIGLPEKVTCISARDDWIVVGFLSGDLMSVKLRGSPTQMNEITERRKHL